MYIYIYIYIYVCCPPACAYIFLSLQEDTYNKQTFLGRRPTFQLSKFPIFQFSGPNFPFFPFSQFSGPNFPIFPIFWALFSHFSNFSGLESWKVRPRKIGKLEKWKVRPRKIGKLEIWKNGKIRPRKIGKLEKFRKLGPEKLENGKIGKLGPGKLGGYAPKVLYVKGSSTNVQVRCSSFSEKQLHERTSAVFKLPQCTTNMNTNAFIRINTELIEIQI